MGSLCWETFRAGSLRGETLCLGSLCGESSLCGETLGWGIFAGRHQVFCGGNTVIEATCNRSTADDCFDVTSSSTVYSATTSGTGCYTDGTPNVSGDGATAGNAARTGTGDVTASGTG